MTTPLEDVVDELEIVWASLRRLEKVQAKWTNEVPRADRENLGTAINNLNWAVKRLLDIGADNGVGDAEEMI